MDRVMASTSSELRARERPGTLRCKPQESLKSGIGTWDHSKRIVNKEIDVKYRCFTRP
jgi:hypothetical protein